MPSLHPSRLYTISTLFRWEGWIHSHGVTLDEELNVEVFNGEITVDGLAQKENKQTIKNVITSIWSDIEKQLRT